METLSNAIKITKVTERDIMVLIKLGRISYATDGMVYLVNVDDILYHKEQVRLRKLSETQLNQARQSMLLRNAGATQAQINKVNAIKVAKSTKVIKR